MYVSPPTEGITGSVVHRLDACSFCNPHTTSNRQNAHNFANRCMTRSNGVLPNSQSELAFPSTGSWLPSRLSSTLYWSKRIERIFSKSKYAKKRDILSEKQESGMAPKKREFTPESGNVDTYGMITSFVEYPLDIWTAASETCNKRQWVNTGVLLNKIYFVCLNFLLLAKLGHSSVT